MPIIRIMLRRLATKPSARIRISRMGSKTFGDNNASRDALTRHRLNRGGNRQANAALHRVVIVRLR
ncbi:MAG: hypothetical protein K5Q68_18975, partial [Roseococcus sp.]|nr:hypothetical protein [Roseococcus sp.]